VILDTNALSAVADDEPAVVRVYSQTASMELPVIVLGEYRFGVGQSRRRSEYEKTQGIGMLDFYPTIMRVGSGIQMGGRYGM
jgi:predicted nucleic acid-binding protein